MNMFYHCNISIARRQIKPMHNSIDVLARKMGFPEVILPGEVRNDLYLTLVAGEFARGSKTSDKNIEVSVVVCNEQGALVPGALSLGPGAGNVDEYRSVIYYHDDRPKWNETFRVSVRQDTRLNSTIHGTHVIILFGMTDPSLH